MSVPKNNHRQQLEWYNNSAQSSQLTRLPPRGQAHINNRNQMNVEAEHADVYLDVLSTVVRNVQKADDDWSWIGFTIFHPERLQQTKVAMNLNTAMLAVIRQRMKDPHHKLAPGDLVQFRRQTFSIVAAPSELSQSQSESDRPNIQYRLQFSESGVFPPNLQMFYVSDPCNRLDRRAACFINCNRSQQQQNTTTQAALETDEAQLISEYLAFNDYVDYREYAAQIRAKEMRKKQKRNAGHSKAIAMRTTICPTNLVQVQQTHNSNIDIELEQENEVSEFKTAADDGNHDIAQQVESSHETQARDDPELSLSQSSSQNSLVEAYQLQQAKHCDANTARLKQQHLYIPPNIVAHPDQLVQFDEDNAFRLIWDSDDDDDDDAYGEEDEQQQPEAQRLRHNRNDYGRNFLDSLVKDMEAENNAGQWSTSDCNQYWVRNDKTDVE